MVDFGIKNVFAEIEKALAEKGANNVSFEDTNNRYEKVLCVGDVRAGNVKISYPDGYNDSSDCCNVSVSFDFYVKDDVSSGINKFDWFIDKFIKLTDAR